MIQSDDDDDAMTEKVSLKNVNLSTYLFFLLQHRRRRRRRNLLHTCWCYYVILYERSSIQVCSTTLVTFMFSLHIAFVLCP